jgi:hypothetical protein
MISIVICSIDPNLLLNLEKNISETIGIPYEIISTDNRNSNKGLCQVYNEGFLKSNYDNLCFLHEDVKFHTTNWGVLLVNLLKIQEIGLVGVSGSVYKSSFPSSWAACSFKFYRMNTIQHYSDLPSPLTHKINPGEKNYSYVVTVDGVLLATRKDVFSEYSFDKKILNGFHGYDLDLSMQIREKYKIVVSHQILLEHFSSGNFNSTWVEDTILIHKKWKNSLPIKFDNSRACDYQSDYIALSSFLNLLLKMPGKWRLVLKYYLLLNTLYLPLNKFRFSKSFLYYLTFKTA